MYVSPIGDNNNIGTYPNAPLKDIWFALLKLESDSLQPDTIHITPGIYKMSTGEKYPLSLKRHVIIQGNSMDSCILDAEDEIYHLHGIDYYSAHYKISDLTLQYGNGVKNIAHGFSSIYIRLNPFSVFENLRIVNNYSRLASMAVGNSNAATISNCQINENIGGVGLQIGKSEYYLYYEPAQISNCIVQRNVPDYSMPPEEGYYGRGISTFCVPNSPYPFEFILLKTQCIEFFKMRGAIF